MDKTFTEHNALATFPDMESARAAIGTLEDHGVDASMISLLGRAAEEADDPAQTPARDEATTDLQVKTLGKGAAIGAGVGGSVGFLAGLAAFGIPGLGPVVAGGIWAMVLGGAAAGGGVGMAESGYHGFKESEAWADTLADVRTGKVIVGLHADSEEELRRPAELLKSAAGSVRYFDTHGNAAVEQADSTEPAG